MLQSDTGPCTWVGKHSPFSVRGGQPRCTRTEQTARFPRIGLLKAMPGCICCGCPGLFDALSFKRPADLTGRGSAGQSFSAGRGVRALTVLLHRSWKCSLQVYASSSTEHVKHAVNTWRGTASAVEEEVKRKVQIWR